MYDKFVSLLLDKAKALKLGHGAHPDTTMGPVTTARGLDKADEHVADAKSRGAKVLHGGQRREGEGYFFHPTVIGEATDEMRLVKEEQFAPIAAVLKFETEEEVVRRANDTSVSGLYALCGSFSRSVAGRMIDSILVTGWPGQLFLHEGCRSHVEAVGKSGGWNDWNEHRFDSSGGEILREPSS